MNESESEIESSLGAADGGALPQAARRELARALGTLGGGGNLLMHTAKALARAAGAMARLPLLRLVAARSAGTVLRPAAEAALTRAFDIAVVGLRPPAPTMEPDIASPLARLGRLARLDRAAPAHAAAAVSGAVGGLAGLAGSVPDTAFTTLLLMRQIAAVAIEEGEDLAEESTRRACLEVFALPGSEEGYWGARLLMRGAPLVGLLRQAARAWGVAVSEKLAAGAVPVAGAAGGALINTAFLSHYRTLARAHFTIRRLERTYGAERVRAAASALRDEPFVVD